ncbi:immunoglobulin-like domain-containing protein [Candidatus Enterococcus mansonii]|uniref:Bacterial Ig domain-containing protein n=1 Tax=Candidatus Enterococcus mansonii TaxID=1834181 RepID=A0A242CH54_9ENTE|nr:immunoglobulin-like domain-containing protein [Enterococcus sp. 4G2_DIV0659]OTO09567.1 hypothetical protein A5880_000246 [Enterococcus sp. 4G2_DIV0659]
MKLKKVILGSMVCFSALLLFHSGEQVYAEENKISEETKEIQGRAISPFVRLKPQTYEVGLDTAIQGAIESVTNPKEFDEIATVQLFVNDELKKEAPIKTIRRFEVPTDDLTIKETDKVEIQAINVKGEKVRERVLVTLKVFSVQWNLDSYMLFDDVITGKVIGTVTAIEVVEEYVDGNGVLQTQSLVPKTPVVNGEIKVPIDMYTIYDETANVKIIPYKGNRKGAVGEKLPVVAFDLKADIKPFVLNKDKEVTGTFTGKGLAKVKYARLEVDTIVDDSTEVQIDETGKFSILGEGNIYSGAEVNIVTYDENGNELVSFPVNVVEQKRIKDYFPDPNLAQVVAGYLGGGRTVESFVTEEELAVKNYMLEAQGKGVKDITGIEYLQPKIIFLQSNEIEDLTPFARMKTNRYTDNLQLQHNKIKDISPLIELGKYSPTVMCHLLLSANELDNNAIAILRDNKREFRHILHLELMANHIDDFSNIRKSGFWGGLEWFGLQMNNHESVWRPHGQKVKMAAQPIVNGRLEVTMPGLDIDNKPFTVVDDLYGGKTTPGYTQTGNKVVWENLPSDIKEVKLNVTSIGSLNNQIGKPFPNQTSVYYTIPVK